MSVSELHGIFHFTDDMFEDAPQERTLTVDKTYNPIEVFPYWFDTENGNENENDRTENSSWTEDRLKHLLPSLYQRGEFEKCLQLALERLSHFKALQKSSSANIAGILRDLAETAVLCHIKLNSPHLALPLLPLLDGVEEPGRLIIKSKIFSETKHFRECAEACREYLSLRSGDYQISIRLAQCLLQIDGSDRLEILNLLTYALNTVQSTISSVGGVGILSKKLNADLVLVKSLLNLNLTEIQ